LNPEGDTSDVVATLKLKGLVDGLGQPVEGAGSFFVLVQATVHDRVSDLEVGTFAAGGLWLP
jgi:hypothetical protein